jgi:RND family efflux transporter MFP subunit
LAALKANLEKLKNGARDEERRQVEATVQQAKASLDNAQADMERMENLYKERVISKQTLDATRTGTTVAEAQYEAALQQLKMLETGAREEDITAMESQVSQAEAGLEISRSMANTRSWEKDIKMAEAGYNQAKAALESARATEEARTWEDDIARAEAGLDQAQVALELAQEMLSNATIKAPIGGVVSQRFMDKGDMASPVTPIFNIVAMNNVKAVVNITETDIAKVSLNDEANVYVKSYTGEKMTGKITMISPTVKIMSRTIPAEITIDNSSGKLKPGMFAEVIIPVEIHENAFILRRSALIEDTASGDKHIFVIDNHTAKKLKVETGIINKNLVEVSAGVKLGDKVVISGQNYLKDGEQVKTVEVSG